MARKKTEIHEAEEPRIRGERSGASADEVTAIAQALAAPFDASEVKFKPQTVSGNRALAVPFVDARVIQDRLDEVLGVMGWQDSYQCLPDGAVVCRLQIRIGDEWITKEDVGGQSEQPDEGDRRKAAFSDAMKRAAVKFGLGRYLYRCKPQWADYDPQKRQFLRTPTLNLGAAHPPAREPVRTAPPERGPAPKAPEPAPEKAPAQPAAPTPAGKTASKPADGLELHKRLTDRDAELAAAGTIPAGALLAHVRASGRKAGYPEDLTSWPAPAIDLAVEEVRAFLKARSAPLSANPDAAPAAPSRTVRRSA